MRIDRIFKHQKGLSPLINGGSETMLARIILKLKRLAAECSLLAGRELHHLNDDLNPWLASNEELKEYHELLDANTILNKR